MKINRIGETNTNKQGLEMKIIEYRGARDIDVEFEDGLIKRTSYKEFKNGNVKNTNQINSRTIKDSKSRIGEVFKNKLGEEVVIVEYNGCRDVKVYFPLHNYYKTVSYGNLKRNAPLCPYSKSYYGIGFEGEGEYSVTVKGKFTKAGSVWSDMLRRCCSEKYKDMKPFYKESHMCEEWYNFQNFAKWYEENYYEVDGEQMCLDKDILIKGNKKYSPETCIIIPQTINKLIERNKRTNELPLGVHYDKRGNRYIAQCKNTKGNNGYLGYFDSPEEAFYIYKEAKEKRIKQVADKYKGKIPQNVYDALYNYKVDIND